ncbi:MAG: cytochrome P450 [Steroidobacteraceae bacterium]
MSLSLEAAGIALTDPATYEDRPRYHALMAALRREAPLHRAAPPGYRPFWVAAKHADICEIETQPDVFVSGPRLELFSIEQERRIEASTGGNAAVGKTLLHMDGAEHRAYRGMSQAWFMPKNLRNLEQRVAALAEGYVRRMADAGGELEFVAQVSELYPLNVILLIIGLPPEEAPELLRLTRNFTEREHMPVPPGMTREDLIVKGAQDIFDYFGAVYAERLKAPRDDVASVIANAKVDGEPIGAAQALSYLLLLGLAGHDTTNSTMSGAMLALIEHPGEFARLRANPELVNPAVDEMLRWVSPVSNFMRTATRDYALRGQVIRAGEGVLLPFGSANRDEDAFEEPFRFKVDRKPNPQIAFGYGAHACLGQHLAKLELRAFFNALLPRLESVELAGPAVLSAITTAYKTKVLPIRYRMSAGAP